MATTFKAHDSAVTSLCFLLKDEEFISGDEKGSITHWGGENWQKATRFQGQKGKTVKIENATNLGFTSISSEGFVYVWYLPEPKIINKSNISKIFPGIKITISAVSIAQIPMTGTYVLVLDHNCGPYVWLSNNDQYFNIGHENIPVGGNDVAVTRSGKYMVTNSGRALFLYNMDNGQQIRMFGGTPDGLADNEKYFIPTETPQFLATKDLTSRVTGGHSDTITSLRFSVDGKFILSASKDKTVRLWNLQDVLLGRESKPQVFSGPKKAILRAEFAGSNERIIAASEDGTVWVWNSSNGNVCSVTDLKKHPITSFAVTTEGHMWAAGFSDGTVHIENTQMTEGDQTTASPTGQTITQNQPDQRNDELEGVYYRKGETSYLVFRFYKDGLVISANINTPDIVQSWPKISKWFDRSDKDCGKGQYRFSGNTIDFKTQDARNTFIYHGSYHGKKLVLNSINERTGNSTANEEFLRLDY